MPSIDIAMARSVRGGVGGIVARSLQAAFEERGIVSSAETSISSVKESFSSWDNCMAAVYCKWPVIALIIIGALIIISVVWCIARCLCCGLSCCCECCHCLKCCGQCCGCCDPPNGRRRKHLDEPYNNIPDSQGYKREDPMATSALPFDRPRPTTAKTDPPQYASFDVSKKHADGSEDELPAMPVWGDSESKKIHLEEEAVELQQLKPQEPNAPLMNGMSPAGTPGTRTPVQGGVSPYGSPPLPTGSQAASSGYLGGAPGYNQMHNAYGQSTTSFHTEQSWGVTPGPTPMGQEYGSGPGQGHAPPGYGQAGYVQEPEGYGEQSVYGGEYGSANHGPMASGTNNQGYGAGPARSMTGSSTHSMRGGAGYADRGFDQRLLPQRTASPAQQQQQQQGVFDPRLMPQQRTGSPALQQGAFDPRLMPQRTASPAQHQGAFPNDPRMATPQRTNSPAQLQQRSFSPAPQGQRPPRGGGPPGPRYPPATGPVRQMSGDAAHSPPQGRGGGVGGYHHPPRGGQQRQQFSSSPRPGPQQQQQQRMPPPRSQTMDMMEPPRSPGPRDNFSRPMRSNTFDQTQGGGGGEQQQQQQGAGAAYPGYKPYQPAR